jgi:hypothetical protein
MAQLNADKAGLLFKENLEEEDEKRLRLERIKKIAVARE